MHSTTFSSDPATQEESKVSSSKTSTNIAYSKANVNHLSSKCNSEDHYGKGRKQEGNNHHLLLNVKATTVSSKQSNNLVNTTKLNETDFDFSINSDIITVDSSDAYSQQKKNELNHHHHVRHQDKKRLQEDTSCCTGEDISTDHAPCEQITTPSLTQERRLPLKRSQSEDSDLSTEDESASRKCPRRSSHDCISSSLLENSNQRNKIDAIPDHLQDTTVSPPQDTGSIDALDQEATREREEGDKEPPEEIHEVQSEDGRSQMIGILYSNISYPFVNTADSFQHKSSMYYTHERCLHDSLLQHLSLPPPPLVSPQTLRERFEYAFELYHQRKRTLMELCLYAVGIPEHEVFGAFEYDSDAT